MRRSLTAVFVCIALVSCPFGATALAQQPSSDPLEGWLRHVERSLPTEAAKYSDYDTAQMAAAASAIEQWSAHVAHQATLESGRSANLAVRRLLAAKASVDQRIDDMFELRRHFAQLPAGDRRREGVRAFLRTTSELIDLSGRLRYLLSDAVNLAAGRASDDDRLPDELIEMLTEAGSSIGAMALSSWLLDPPASMQPPRRVVSDQLKVKLLRLIVASGDIQLLPTVAALARDEDTPAELVIEATETIRQLGLPQDPRPGQGEDVPRPAITAAELESIVSAVDASMLSPESQSRRDELVAWLRQRRDKGLLGDSLRLGHYEVRPGDWLLMRNPSPYNLFTDLSPGLFTHVGVVGIEEDETGRRRMVLVDLPEIGRTMPATNVDLFVLRSLHYVFVRHPDPEVGRKMGEVVVSTIGNPTEFDLNFRTDRVRALRGRPLAGEKINTYCAGLLMLCAQETTAAREDFFPIPEYVAGGNTAANLAVLGLSIGEDFVSPTGALFSPVLQIVGRRNPMYEPEREIREDIYDHFAQGLKTKTLTPSPDEKQAMLIRLAEMAENNPLLAAAIARSQGVSAEMDLVSAAKAAAVVEMLDDVAYAASDGFFDARQAIRAPSVEELTRQGVSAENLDRLRQLRARHADIFRQWQARTLTPRGLRVALVDYYTASGNAQIDERFFQASADASR